jgi:hypothetical protein
MDWNEWLGIIFGATGFFSLVFSFLCRSGVKIRIAFTCVGIILAILAIVFALLPFTKSCNNTDISPVKTATTSPVNNIDDVLVEITITSPINNALIPMEITVKGYAKTNLPSDEHLYIVVEYGGMWWPQCGEISIGYSQSSGKYEFITPARVGKEEDYNKPFSLRAIVVDSVVHQIFQSWFQQNVSTEVWQGISIVETKQRGTAEIRDSISVIREPNSH